VASTTEALGTRISVPSNRRGLVAALSTTPELTGSSEFSG
jgi:hypothetical protein